MQIFALALKKQFPEPEQLYQNLYHEPCAHPRLSKKPSYLRTYVPTCVLS